MPVRTAVVLVAAAVAVLGGCAARDSISIGSVARHSMGALGDVSDLESRIAASQLSRQEKATAYGKANAIRAMVATLDLTLALAAGERLEPADAAKINAAIDATFRQIRGLTNRPIEIYALDTGGEAEIEAARVRVEQTTQDVMDRLGR